MKYAIIRDGYVKDLDGTLIEVPNDFTDKDLEIRAQIENVEL